MNELCRRKTSYIIDTRLEGYLHLVDAAKINGRNDWHRIYIFKLIYEDSLLLKVFLSD